MCSPLEGNPSSASPARMPLPSTTPSRSTAPTTNPTSSTSSPWYMPGISAVSPPISAQPSPLQARDSPTMSCSTFSVASAPMPM